jgi:hypothetical protein
VVQALELPLAEANLAIVEIRKMQLQQQSSIAGMLGDTARVSSDYVKTRFSLTSVSGDSRFE